MNGLKGSELCLENDSYDEFLDLLLDDLEEDYDETALTSYDQQSVTSSGAGTNNSDNAMAAMKKKRRRLEIPRLFKNDIRRSYSFMYANVLNSMDCDVMTSFLDKYFVKNFRSTYKFLQPIDPANPQNVDIKGFAPFLNMWYIGSLSSPDIVYTMQDSQVKVKADCSAVVCTFTVRGTKLFVTPPPLDFNAESADLDVAVGKKRKWRSKAKNYNIGRSIKSITAMTGSSAAAAAAPGSNNQLVRSTMTGSVITDSIVSKNSNSSSNSNISGDDNNSSRDVELRSSSSSSSSLSVSSQQSQESAAATATSVQQSRFIDDVESTTIKSFLPRPYTLTLHGTLTMYLDAEKRIYSTEYVAKPTIGKADLSSV